MEEKKEKTEKAEETAGEKAGEDAGEEERGRTSPKIRTLHFLYTASTFLVLTILVIGVTMINNYDRMKKMEQTMARMTEDIRRDLAYMTYAPILFISAKTGQRVEKLFDLIDYVANQSAFRVTTGMLNTVLADAQTRVQPPTDKGRRLKIYYMTQVGIRPPHFVVFCNDARLFHFSYQRYLENCIRNTFGLEGTPVRIVIRARGEKV